MAYTPQTTGVISTPQTYNTSPTRWSAAYGGIPQLPKYTTDTTQQAGTDVQAQMIANLPNYQAMVGQATGNIGANLKGQLSPDVTYNLGQQAAERGAGMGQSLSNAAATGFLAKYGLTSNALQTQGQQQLLAQMQATPMQQTSTSQQIQDMSAQQAVFNAAPNPGAAASASMAAAQGGINAGRGSVAMPGSGGGGYAAPTAGMGYGGYDPANPPMDAATRAAVQAGFADTASSQAWNTANTGYNWGAATPTDQAQTGQDWGSEQDWMNFYNQ